MFLFFKRKKIDTLLNGAKEYVTSKYVVSAEEPQGRFSREIDVKYILSQGAKKDEEPEPRVRYSIKEDRPRYSRLKDSYDTKSVSAFMQNLSASSGKAGIAGLEDSIDMSFVDKMLEHINRKQLRDSAVYKAAQVDRRLFSKIVSDRTYKPSKDTCIAFVLALQLSLDEATDMLSRAGYTLSHSSKRDVIIEYFIREKVYSLNDINEILFRLEQKTLGR